MQVAYSYSVPYLEQTYGRCVLNKATKFISVIRAMQDTSLEVIMR